MTDEFSWRMKTRSRPLRFGRRARSPGKLSPLPSSFGPADVSRQSPRARRMVSSHRGRSRRGVAGFRAIGSRARGRSGAGEFHGTHDPIDDFLPRRSGNPKRALGRRHDIFTAGFNFVLPPRITTRKQHFVLARGALIGNIKISAQICLHSKAHAVSLVKHGPGIDRMPRVLIISFQDDFDSIRALSRRVPHKRCQQYDRNAEIEKIAQPRMSRPHEIACGCGTARFHKMINYRCLRLKSATTRPLPADAFTT